MVIKYSFNSCRFCCSVVSAAAALKASMYPAEKKWSLSEKQLYSHFAPLLKKKKKSPTVLGERANWDDNDSSVVVTERHAFAS